MVGMQLVAAYKSLHACDFIHRDVKPDNLAISLQSDDPKIFLLDLGIASRFMFQGTHYKYGEDVGFRGNHMFCSKGMLQGIRPSRRDDLEAVCYVLIYFAKNGLPWDRINSSSAEASFLHRAKKLAMTNTELCYGLAPEYKEFLDYCNALHFEDKPDYEYLSELLRRVAEREGFAGAWAYDWTGDSPAKFTRRRSRHVKVCVSSSQRRLVSIEPSPGTHLGELSTACTPEDAKQHNMDPRREKRLTPGPPQQPSLHCEDPDTPLMPNQLNIEAVRNKLKHCT